MLLNVGSPLDWIDMVHGVKCSLLDGIGRSSGCCYMQSLQCTGMSWYMLFNVGSPMEWVELVHVGTCRLSDGLD